MERRPAAIRMNRGGASWQEGEAPEASRLRAVRPMAVGLPSWRRRRSAGLVDSVKVAPSLDTNEGLAARRQWGIGKLGGVSV